MKGVYEICKEKKKKRKDTRRDKWLLLSWPGLAAVNWNRLRPKVGPLRAGSLRENWPMIGGVAPRPQRRGNAYRPLDWIM